MIATLLKQGEIGGVPFDFTGGERTGGRKTVFHTFVGSDRVIGEDLGREPITFPMKIYVSGILTEYYSKRDALIKQLERPSDNELIHPMYGQVTVMTVGKYSVNETITNLGECKISVTFRLVNNTIRGEEFVNDLEIIEKNNSSKGSIKAVLSVGGNTADGQDIPKEDGFFDKLNNLKKDFVNSGYYKAFKIANKAYEVYENSQEAGFLKSAESVLENVALVQQSFGIAGELMQGNDSYSEFTTMVDNLSFLNNGNDVVNGLSAIGISTGDIFSFVEDNLDSGLDAYNAFKSFRGFGDERTERASKKQTSLENIQTYNNELANRDYYQSLGLIYSCNSIFDIEFSTEDELNTISSEITAELDKQIERQRGDTSLYRDLQALKGNVVAFLSEATTGAIKILEVEVINSSLTNIVYSYYGNLDKYNEIRDLNDFYNPSNITGTVNVLSNG